MKYDDRSTDNLSVKFSELLVATAEASDELVSLAVGEVLRAVREEMHMDVVFVAEFVDGQRVFRHVAGSPDQPGLAVGQSDPLEQSWCQRVVDGRLPQMIPNVADLPNKQELPAAPFSIGTHLSTPIVLTDGKIYGTLCCFSFAPNENIRQQDLTTLQAIGKVMGTRIHSGLSRT